MLVSSMCTAANNERITMSETISNKPFDDAFKSALVHCRQVVVPLVNEAFKTHYGLHEKINFRNTELYNLQGNTERDVDTAFTIGDGRKLYHLECESSNSSVIVRMFEYDTMIALQEREVLQGKLRTRFPNSAVLYLRSNDKTPSKYEITMEVGEQEFSYAIPILKVSDYSLDDIFKKKLYFLLPFHFFVYENDLKDYNSGRKDVKQLLADFDSWMNRLEAVDDQELPADVKGNLQNYAYKVALALTNKHEVLNKEVEEHMGGIVTQYSPVEELINQAVEKAVDKAVDKVTKEKDAEYSAKIESLLAEIARLKAAQGEKSA